MDKHSRHFIAFDELLSRQFPSSGHMEEQNCENSLHFSPLAINWIANNAYGMHGDPYANQHYASPGSNVVHQEHVLVPPLMHCQQSPQNYVEFLAETGYPEIKKQMSYDIFTQVPSLELADPSQSEEHLTPHNVGNFTTAFTSLEPQYGGQEQIWNEESSHGFQVYSGSGTPKPKCTSEARRKRSKEKAYAADRCRRLRISHWLDALKELVPHSKEIGKAALLDNVIDHVKDLQCQVQDLCRSRLGCESTSNSLIFLEGHGHYIAQEQMLNGPLEQMMGKLIDVYPSAATELLQSRGLIVMPTTFAEGLLEPIEMLDTQG